MCPWKMPHWRTGHMELKVNYIFFSQNFIVERKLICAFLAHHEASIKGVNTIMKIFLIRSNAIWWPIFASKLILFLFCS